MQKEKNLKNCKTNWKLLFFLIVVPLSIRYNSRKLHFFSRKNNPSRNCNSFEIIQLEKGLKNQWKSVTLISKINIIENTYIFINSQFMQLNV